MRGRIVDLFPAGEEQALRLDFFGDEIESVRRFDPADQRTIGTVDGFTLLPASETLLDEDSDQALPRRAIASSSAPTPPAIRSTRRSVDGRRLAGMDHWLPLFEERLATLFDHLGDDDVIVRDPGDAGAPRRGSRRSTIIIANRERAHGRRSPAATARSRPTTLYLASEEWAARSAARPLHVTSPFHEPESDKVIDFGVDGPRDFAPERAQDANVYEAVAHHVAKLRKDKKKVVLASYTTGARERLPGLLADHGLKSLKLADSWQEALGARTDAALIVLPLDHGFTAPDVAVLTEQDMLGDRLVRRRKRRKSADAFLAELATLTPGRPRRPCRSRHRPLRGADLGSRSARRRTIASRSNYAGGDKLYVPVENIDILSRYGGDERGRRRSTGSAARPGSGASRG